MPNGNIRLNFLHICENAFYSDDKKLNIIGIFDRITTSGFPATHPRFSIALGISNLGPHIGEIKIKNPDSSDLFKAPLSRETIKNVAEHTNLVINIIAPVFRVPGKYKVLVEFDGAILDSNRDDFIDIAPKEDAT